MSCSARAYATSLRCFARRDGRARVTRTTTFQLEALRKANVSMPGAGFVELIEA